MEEINSFKCVDMFPHKKTFVETKLAEEEEVKPVTANEEMGRISIFRTIVSSYF